MYSKINSKLLKLAKLTKNQISQFHSSAHNLGWQQFVAVGYGLKIPMIKTLELNKNILKHSQKQDGFNSLSILKPSYSDFSLYNDLRPMVVEQIYNSSPDNVSTVVFDSTVVMPYTSDYIYNLFEPKDIQALVKSNQTRTPSALYDFDRYKDDFDKPNMNLFFSKLGIDPESYFLDLYNDTDLNITMGQYLETEINKVKLDYLNFLNKTNKDPTNIVHSNAIETDIDKVCESLNINRFQCVNDYFAKFNLEKDKYKNIKIKEMYGVYILGL
jgi:hypothetical protein